MPVYLFQTLGVMGILSRHAGLLTKLRDAETPKLRVDLRGSRDPEVLAWLMSTRWRTLTNGNDRNE